ncbi:hypothetical protein Kisp01_00640 [Kineosporia sp. NBRC 101677]|uniref:endonuclease/exonuclease/phosphatase family protein n=1 Tax=Kineosporia sp. NBRC 101677 TaxID=3032197 RepID=UPI0024A02857|nr:endonuclease/exonuclease/phosphatase family protein [Kineosporia sp. NBRC 101677]GLY13048.1 hypothetical protein Kisp01_00640 [Kineosporia sp. NBRC 101677]
MDGRSPERGSSRAPENGAAPQQPRKTRRELRAEREAAERARTGEQPTRPAQPAMPPSGRPGAGRPGAGGSGSWFDQPAGPEGPARPGAAPEQPRPSVGQRIPGPHQQNPAPGRGAQRQAPRPWDDPEPQTARQPEKPERGPLSERFPARPTPFNGVQMRREDLPDRTGNHPIDRTDAPTETGRRPQARENALPRPGSTTSRRDRGARLRPSPDEPLDEHFDEEHDGFEDEFDDQFEEHEEPEPRRPVDPRRHRRIAIGLTGVALLLGLWSATMFVDSASPLLTAPSALAPLVAIFALPVLAIGLSGKHWIPTGIAAVAALLPWAMVAGYASSRDAPAGNLATVRVLTVEGSHGAADANAIADAARDYAADVVVVTGLNTTLAHDLTEAGLDRQAPAQGIVQVGSEGSNGIGIWSRLAVSDLTELEGFSKPAASGVLEAGTARIGLTVAQMPGGVLMPGPDWRADLRRLAEQKVAGAETGSFLVGDLNAAPWQPAFRALEKAGWEDAADVVGKGLRPTWPAWSPLPVTPADHLLVDEGIGVASTATVDISGSPHRALVVALEVPTG